MPIERVADADAVLADTRWLAGAQRLFDAAAMVGKPSVFDGDAGDPQQVRDTARLATHPFLSQSMLQSLQTGEPKDALPQLFGGRNVVCGVTLGAAGVMWFDGEHVSSAPSPRVKVVDTLAAGGTWHGAFALALAERKELQAAIEFATAVAAMKCTRFGGRAGIPKRDQFERWWAGLDRGSFPANQADAETSPRRARRSACPWPCRLPWSCGSARRRKCARWRPPA